MKLLIYVLQVSACTGIFYLFYKICLSRLTFFTLNRWYLLGSLLLSFVIPFISVPPVNGDKMVIAGNLHPGVAGGNLVFREAGPILNSSVSVASFSWPELINSCYIIIAGALCLKLFGSLILLWLRLNGRSSLVIEGVKVLECDGQFGNGSFFSYIFIDRSDLTEENIKYVLAHEVTHVRLFHSLDKLAAQLVQSILWFNPFSYWYSRAIAENQEFEVDQIVTGEVEKSRYAELVFLLSQRGNKALVSDFSMAPVKRRILVMFKQPSKNMKRSVYLLALPLVVLCGLAFGKKENSGITQQPPLTVKAAEKVSVPSGDTVRVLPTDADVQNTSVKEGSHAKPDGDTAKVVFPGNLKYSASDSIRFSRDGKVIDLYGKAVVEFIKERTLIRLTAANIRINQAQLELSGRGEQRNGITGEYQGKAKMTFKKVPADESGSEVFSKEENKGMDQQMEADTIIFNLRNMKGKSIGK